MKLKIKNKFEKIISTWSNITRISRLGIKIKCLITLNKVTSELK